jgi:hypothetical protein
MFIVSNNDDISGEVLLRIRDSPFDHAGVQIELVGIISIT